MIVIFNNLQALTITPTICPSSVVNTVGGVLKRQIVLTPLSFPYIFVLLTFKKTLQNVCPLV